MKRPKMPIHSALIQPGTVAAFGLVVTPEMSAP
jgi:hypothetical protein